VLFFKLDPVILVRASVLGSGISSHVLLRSISLIGVNRDLITPARDTAFFEGESVDYGPKLRCCPERTFVEMGRSEG
jgi:hypothetical protein